MPSPGNRARFFLHSRPLLPGVAFCEESGNHSRARRDTELGKYATDMRANGPTADVQDPRNGFVRVAPCDHSGNLLLARAQGDKCRVARRHADHQVAYAVDIGVDDYLFTRKIRTSRNDGVTCTNDMTDKLANEFVEARMLFVAVQSGAPTVRLAPCNHCHHTSPNSKQ